MRRFGWYAVSAVVAAIILGSVLLLAANLYVQSQTVQQRIRLALTSTLRMPVTIRKTTVSPWEGLRIDGITARAEGMAHPSEPDFLEAESFRVRFALWPLLQRRLVVNLVWLDKPNVTWAQDSDGRWQFPPNPDAEHHRKKQAPTPAPTVPNAVAPPPSIVTASPSPRAASQATDGASAASLGGFHRGARQIPAEAWQPRFSQRQTPFHRPIRGRESRWTSFQHRPRHGSSDV